MTLPLLLSRNRETGGVDMFVRASSRNGVVNDNDNVVPLTPMPVLPSLTKISFISWQQKHEADLQRLVYNAKRMIADNISKSSLDVDVDWHAFAQRLRRIAYNASSSSFRSHKRVVTHTNANAMTGCSVHDEDTCTEASVDEFAGTSDTAFFEMMLGTFGIVMDQGAVEQNGQDECQ